MAPADPGKLPGLGRRFTLYIGAAYLAFAVAMVATVNVSQRSLALEEARQKARILIDRNLATHAYFAGELKPAVFPLAESVDPKRYFDPAWMSSTYAVRQIDGLFKKLGGDNGDFYYKESAVDARSPLNEADPDERAFIEAMKRDPRLSERSGVREFGGKRYFVVMRRGETMEAGCLRCHTRPEVAPSGLVERYGPKRSFGRTAGELVSAISIRIPVERAYANANRLSAKLGGILLLGLVGLFAVQRAVVRRYLLSPVEEVSRAASGIASDERELGKTVTVPGSRELAAMAEAFNAMSTSLATHRDHLERLVEERTGELRETNRILREKIDELEQARGDVRELSGLLPICMSCKKIRNDGGYWDAIEEYLTRHAQVTFSHGICGDCLEKFYPGMVPKK